MPVIDAFPDAAQTQDGDGSYPIHRYLAREAAQLPMVERLLEVFPLSVLMDDHVRAH